MRRRITLPGLALLAGIAIVGVVGGLAYRQLALLDERAHRVSHTHEVRETAYAVAIALADAVSARRAYALTGDDAALEPYRAAVQRLATARGQLRLLTGDNPHEQRRLDQLDPEMAARLAQLDDAIRQRRELGFSAEREASATAGGSAVTLRIRGLIRDLQDEERALLDAREAELRSESELVRGIMLAGFLASAGLLVLAFVLLRREIARRARSEEALAERERRIAIVLDSIGDAVIATDAAAVITHCNPVAEALTGWPAREAIGTAFARVFRIISEKTRDAEPDPVARVLAERAPVGLANHTALIARDGTERPIADSAAPIFDERGELRGAVIVFRDVSEARRSEARFRRFLEGAPDGIVVAGADGRIAVVNDQASALFGYPADELIGQPVEILVPERARARHAQHRLGYHAAPAVRAMGAALQLVARRKDGTAFPVEVGLSPFEAPDGTQVLASVRDITRRRELEQFRDEYVGYISHDLKNPLSIIILQARLLARQLEGRVTDEDLRALRVIADSAGFIDRLVRELLEMAYVESDQLELHREPVALARFLGSVLERTLSTADRARVRLEIAAAPTVDAERSRLERVVVNFVQNAIKYAPPGSPIAVRLAVDGDRAVVSVTDRGPGVPPAQRSLVFEKYKRTDAARAKEGVGLGLYVSRKIIEAHGGEIGVEGAPGEGATFFFRLAQIAAPVAAPAADAPPVAGPPGPAPSPRSGARVLVVDDEVNALSALTALLGDEGLEAVGAASAERALALAEAQRPDAVVLDVQMPGMSGLELLDRLRARYPGLPAVIMTGHQAHHAGIPEAREAGAAFVEKPVDVDELLRALERLLVARSAS